MGRPGAGPDDGPGDASVLIGTEGVLHRAASASLVVFLDFDHELLAPRYRAGEQALALLALASRVVGGRRREGRVVVRTRLPDHEVLRRGPACGPGTARCSRTAAPALLRLPPATALALVSGDGAEQVAARLKSDPTVEVGGLAAGRFLIRAAGADALADDARRGRSARPGRPHRGRPAPGVSCRGGVAESMTCYRDRCRPRSAQHGACVRPRLLPFLSSPGRRGRPVQQESTPLTHARQDGHDHRVPASRDRHRLSRGPGRAPHRSASITSPSISRSTGETTTPGGD